MFGLSRVKIDATKYLRVFEVIIEQLAIVVSCFSRAMLLIVVSLGYASAGEPARQIHADMESERDDGPAKQQSESDSLDAPERLDPAFLEFLMELAPLDDETYEMMIENGLHDSAKKAQLEGSQEKDETQSAEESKNENE